MSELNQIIAPEIKRDRFYRAIQKLAREAEIKTVLEIGSSSGEGSTDAFVTGLQQNPHQPTLFCVEASKPRFQKLQQRYRDNPQVKCYNVSSIALENFPHDRAVIDFYQTIDTDLNTYPLDRVLGWLHQDIQYVQESQIRDRGIEIIKQENGIDSFDLVLIDGSEFTGEQELEEVYGAKYILLDDINTFKNHNSHQRLLDDLNYRLVEQDRTLRNGYSIFVRTGDRLIQNNPQFPIHFFTIVLNGEPFIRYHIDIFKQLGFPWHWHIIEGVAALKHDTAWSLKLGGEIPSELHNDGKSSDGTTEYIDQLRALYPDNITLYRKPEGKFWDGKREMVNAPLENILEPCLLWQIDVDELWTVEQICQARQLFLDRPQKTAAYYSCWYFVGEQLAIDSRNSYSPNALAEWPQQAWLRTWRFNPGFRWEKHEPPQLVESLSTGEKRDIASIDPMRYEETGKEALIFQHFAYVTAKQLTFKEKYYGYKNAVAQWEELQKHRKFPTFINRYFSWVDYEAIVDTIESSRIIPLAQKEQETQSWYFLSQEEVQQKIDNLPTVAPKIALDGVVFQTGSSAAQEIWRSLLEEWASSSFYQHILLLDRAGTAPKILGLQYRPLVAYDEEKTGQDSEQVQQVCDREQINLFISTTCTTPLSTPSFFLDLDRNPDASLEEKERIYAILHACSCITSSSGKIAEIRAINPQLDRDCTIEISSQDDRFDASEIANIILQTTERIQEAEIVPPSPLWKEFRQLQQQLQALQTRDLTTREQSNFLQLQALFDRIEAMKGSKFWQLRNLWFRLKASIGRAIDEQNLQVDPNQPIEVQYKQAQQIIVAMESSKFWQLRKVWLQFKQRWQHRVWRRGTER